MSELPVWAPYVAYDRELRPPRAAWRDAGRVRCPQRGRERRVDEHDRDDPRVGGYYCDVDHRPVVMLAVPAYEPPRVVDLGSLAACTLPVHDPSAPRAIVGACSSTTSPPSTASFAP